MSSTGIETAMRPRWRLHRIAALLALLGAAALLVGGWGDGWSMLVGTLLLGNAALQGFVLLREMARQRLVVDDGTMGDRPPGG